MITIALAVDGSSSTAGEDVSIYSRQTGFAIHFLGIAGGSTYKIEASLESSPSTWIDITKSFVDLSSGALFTADVAANTLAVLQAAVPGMIRIRNTHTGTGTPTAILGSHGGV